LYSTYIKVVGGCQIAPINPEKWMEREKNACLSTAIAFKEGSWRTRVYVDNPIQISQQAENIRSR